MEDETRAKDCCCCCVFNEKTKEPVPLKAIDVSITVSGYLVNVESTLSYENDGKQSIEAIFNFPVDENGAVYKFEMEIDGRKVVAECREKEEAKKTYDEAIKEGHTASYLSENDSTSDIFTCRLGNLHPNKKAVVKFAYVSELVILEGGGLKFVLPTLLNPRYNPSIEKGGSKDATEKYVKGCDQPYGFEVVVAIDGVGRILDVTSSKDKLNVSFENENNLKALVKLSDKFIADHDFEFQINIANAYMPRILIEKGKDTSNGILKKDTLMLNFFPSLKNSLSHKHEFIFILDRSGSMGGSRIENAKESLLLFLKSLPMGSFFNIIGFGSQYEALFKEESVPYSEENLKKALAYHECLQADMGGTEILEPLKYIYNRPLISSHSRQILLITDGEVYNTGTVIRLVQSNSHDARVFTLGIGEGASTSLVKGVARAGKGKAEFVKTGEKMQPVVMRMLKSAMQTSVTDVRIDWKFNGSPDMTVIPQQLPPIFDGDRLAVYATINSSAILEGQVVLKGKIGEQELEYPLIVDGRNILSSVHVEEYMPIHRMAAKIQIKQLQDSDSTEEKTNKAAIIALSLASNVVSSYTAMVGIDREEKKVVEGCLITCEIPNVWDPTLAYAGAPMMMAYSATPHAMMACAPAPCPMNQPPGGQMYKCKRSMKAAVPSMMNVQMDCALVSGPMVTLEAKTTQSPFLLIIGLVEFNGYWKFCSELLKIISIDEKIIKDSSPVKNLDVWTTAVVISYFRIKCQDQKEEWEMIEMKALQWLSNQDLEGNSIEDLLKKAEQVNG